MLMLFIHNININNFSFSLMTSSIYGKKRVYLRHKMT